MIYGRHAGINVLDIEASLHFYEQALLMTVVERRTEQGEYIDKLTMIPGTLQHWVKVATDDGWMLELVQWETPKRYEGHQLIMYDYPGLNHICFRVASVEVFHRALEVSGYKPTDIQTDPPGKVRNFVCRDPDGVICEFVEVL
jgi:catechol 2,3-dioxygenase-like lactoylglutathione lyase family enzyme